MNSLAVKAFTANLVGLVIFSACLFFFAGTFAFWQAWIFLPGYFISALLITRYLLKHDPGLLQRRLKGGLRAEKRISQKIIITLLQLAFLLLLAIAGLDHRRHGSHVPTSLVILANFGVLLGMYLQHLAFRANTFAAIVVAIVPEQKVISTGTYAVIRHPMYAGILVASFFMPVALGSWYACPCFLMIVGVVLLRLLAEEKFLHQSLPGYAEYCKKVPYRLFPRLW
jgi:protein-S-isoprenylcysteine O-methyltransferase Ste14